MADLWSFFSFFFGLAVIAVVLSFAVAGLVYLLLKLCGQN